MTWRWFRSSSTTRIRREVTSDAEPDSISDDGARKGPSLTLSLGAMVVCCTSPTIRRMRSAAEAFPLHVEKVPEQFDERGGLIPGNRVPGARHLDVARVRLRLQHLLRDLGAEDVRVRSADEQSGAGDGAPQRPEIDRIAPAA